MNFKVLKIVSALFILFSIFFSFRFSGADESQDEGKDPWPLIVKEDLNVVLIGTYGEYRKYGDYSHTGHYHLAIDIQSRKGEPVFNNRDGVLLECVKISEKAQYRIIIGDPETLEGREFTHVEPLKKVQRMEPGTSFIKKGELIAHVGDYRNDADLWNDHLHYAYVRIQRAANKEGDALNVIEGIEHPLNRLEITPEIRKVLRDAPPQIVEPVTFIPDEGEKGAFGKGPIYGKVDILVHAFDRMGQSVALGKHAPAPYEFEWRIIEPEGFENAGGKLLMDGRVPLVRPGYQVNYIEHEEWLGDFQILITNGMASNGYWFTDESKSNPGYQARTPEDARFPDGKYTIEVIIREHPALGIPQRESKFTACVTIDNFPD